MTAKPAEKPQKTKNKGGTAPTIHAWDKRPWPAAGYQKSVIYRAVGEALSAWEEYENMLSLIFAAIVNPDPSQLLPARRAFGSVRSFEARAAVLEAALKAYDHEKPSEKFFQFVMEIIKDGRRYCARRNEIAHGVVEHFRPEGLSFLDALFVTVENEKPIKRLYCLLPSESSTQHYDVKEHPLYCYTKPELTYFTAQFRNLKKRSDAVWLALMKISQLKVPKKSRL